MAADRTTGVELTEELYPAVVLIDVGLPGQNGYEVARRIRATWLRAEDVARALEAGFDAHLTKPVTMDRLAAIVAPR